MIRSEPFCDILCLSSCGEHISLLPSSSLATFRVPSKLIISGFCVYHSSNCYTAANNRLYVFAKKHQLLEVATYSHVQEQMGDRLVWRTCRSSFFVCLQQTLDHLQTVATTPFAVMFLSMLDRHIALKLLLLLLSYYFSHLSILFVKYRCTCDIRLGPHLTRNHFILLSVYLIIP